MPKGYEKYTDSGNMVALIRKNRLWRRCLPQSRTEDEFPSARIIRLEGQRWAGSLVNPEEEKDRYMLTAPFSKKAEAEHFKVEFQRLAGHTQVFKKEGPNG